MASKRGNGLAVDAFQLDRWLYRSLLRGRLALPTSRPASISLACYFVSALCTALTATVVVTGFEASHRGGYAGRQGDGRIDGGSVLVLISLNSGVSVGTPRSVLAQPDDETPDSNLLVRPRDGALAVASMFPAQLVLSTGSLDRTRTAEEIYLGQIKARVERVWMADRLSFDVPERLCRVQITQSESGEVGDVAFDRCVATEDWKASLALAIRHASPLPSPPDARAFTKEVSLEF